MKMLLACLLGVGVALSSACGDDSGPGGAGQGGASSATTGAGTNATSTTGATTQTAGGTTTASTGASGSTGTSMNGFGCTENTDECITSDMDCQCNGVCSLCNDIECFSWDLAVDCINGFAGVTCTCTVDGQAAGSCDEDAVVCSLETSCCVMFLTP